MPRQIETETPVVVLIAIFDSRLCKCPGATELISVTQMFQMAGTTVIAHVGRERAVKSPDLTELIAHRLMALQTTLPRLFTCRHMAENAALATRQRFDSCMDRRERAGRQRVDFQMQQNSRHGKYEQRQINPRILNAHGVCPDLQNGESERRIDVPPKDDEHSERKPPVKHAPRRQDGL